MPFDKFVGMEANSVLYIISQSEDDYTNDPRSIRCNISRAVAQLSIIMEMKPDTLLNSYSNKILFHSTEVDPNFVECHKTIKYDAFKCDSNHLLSPSAFQQPLSGFSSSSKTEKYVCQACIHICHNNHNPY